MSTAGTTIELALSALFELCVPAVSGGVFPQGFPAHLIIPLTDAERAAHSFVADTQAYRIENDDGLILVWLENGSCRITTGDGDPALIRDLFLARLPDENATIEVNLSPDQTPPGIVARMPLSPSQFILILFLAGESAGFYGSARAYTQPTG